jgi:hypothetical protein
MRRPREKFPARIRISKETYQSFCSSFARVGGPAFMRGKKRFSASGKVSTLIMRFSAGIEKSRGYPLLKQGAATN